LQKNWRSQPKMVAAVNAIFQQREHPFIYGDSIEFTAASAASRNQHRFLRQKESESCALTLWHLSELTGAGSTSQEDLLDPVNRTIAEEILHLLEPGNAHIEDKPVSSGDIAILVRSARQGHLLSIALNRRGIRSVTIGREKVFDSDEALGLLELLRAILHQSSQTTARRSLASNLFYFDYQAIASIGDDDQAWQNWNEKLYTLHQRWSKYGFIAMFQQLLQSFQIAQRLARRDDAERRLTNLLHLGELLHQQAAQRAGMESLLGWLQTQMEDSNIEAAELRLESDEALVKIVTIHKSKGLQYPIVFVPFLWSCTPTGKSNPLSFHDAQFDAFIDLGSNDFDNNRLRAEKERLAEDIRLLYVALTRAQSKTYLVWGQASSAAQTALAYLLHSHQTPLQLEQQLPNGFPAEMNLCADLQTLAQASGGSIETLALPTATTAASLYIDDSAIGLLEPDDFNERRTSEWRVNSFTGLTRDVHQVAHRGETRSQGDAILDFPAGSHVGLLIHSLLEHLDFQQDISSQCQQLVPRYANRFGLGSDSYQKLLQLWIESMLNTALDDRGLKLSSLSNAHRLNELSFDFAFDHLDIARLNAVVQAASDASLEPLSTKNFGGLITGVIDLVFYYEGKYYLADYKSNHLGSSLDDYRPDQLKQAMIDRRYDLQSLIYTIALHRYLTLRVPGYQYEEHFGGSFYLFLRGMRPLSGPDTGVYFERVGVETIAALEAEFDYSGVTAFAE
jgi:exodeoxyribonuclease V beta subunit